MALTDAVMICARIKVRLARGPVVSRKMLRRLWNCFDHAGIAILYPHPRLVQPALAGRGESRLGGGPSGRADMLARALQPPALSGR